MTFVEQWQEVWEQWKRKAGIVAMVVLTCAVFYHVIFGANGWVVYQQKKAEYRRLQGDYLKFTLENAALQKDVKSLKTDKAAIEREAREQLHYTRPGEKVYVMPPSNAGGGNAPVANTAEKR